MALALTLRVGDTDTQDVSLTSGGVVALDYPMQAPDVDQATLQGLGDGNNLGVPSWSNVTESFDLLVTGATASEVSDKMRAIERLLDLARQSTTGWLADKLYLLAQFDHDSEAWRSQILAAQLVPGRVTDEIYRNKVVVTLIITRRYYWETAALHDVAMTSGVTTTPTTGYVTVYNADDAHLTNQNWWDIAADQVVGSIPAPAKLTILNNSGGERFFGSMHIGNYVWTNPQGVDPIFRIEEVAGTLAAGTTETDVAYWALSTALVESFKGQFGRIVAVFTALPEPTTLIRPALQYRFPTPIFDLALGEQILSSAANPIVDLGGIPIPPGGYWDDLGLNLYLTIKAKALAPGDTITPDWVQIFPSGAGRYRTIRHVTNWTLAAGESVVDDGPANAVYGILSGNAIPTYRGFFEPIHLWPGRQQRLRMVISGGTAYEPDQPWSIKMQYRPRRLTV